MSLSPGVLWQNARQTVTLIDIPYSIAAAQLGEHQSVPRRLLSCPPLQTPFATVEPKSAATRARVENNSSDAELHLQYQHILHEALAEVKEHHKGHWCLHRSYAPHNPPPRTKKRKQDQSTTTPSNESDEYSIVPPLPSSPLTSSPQSRSTIPPIFYPSSPPPPAPASASLRNTLITNPTTSPLRFQPTPINPSLQREETYHLPPGSSFHQSPCLPPTAFHASIRRQADENSTRRHFDFILLDPPWPNRSVRRTHPSRTYNTLSTVHDTRRLLLAMDLDMLLSDNALVGIWTTNKPGVRDLVAGEDGLFDCWGVEVEEEWIWVKTTVRGEPVTALEGVWRKPYEVLLLGRRRRAGCTNVPSAAKKREATVRRRRVIIGVPDLHSRKPCLKVLIEQLMADERQGYRALEIFARHLVAGWWSWGDECAKFNADCYWEEENDSK